jgi:hypothetical protein
MKHFILACALAVSGAAAQAQPAERCGGATPAAGASGACPRPAPPAPPVVQPIAPPTGKTEHSEGIDAKQTPYKAGLRQQCDAMAEILKPDGKLTPKQEEQVRAQHRAFRC